MKYIIYANNLAGKLNLLEQKDFNKLIVDNIKQYKLGKKLITK